MTFFKQLITVFLSVFIFTPYFSYCQLSVNPNQTATVLATKLAGQGITILSPVLTCTGVANGTFVSTSTPIIIDSGILLTSGRATGVIGPESFLANTSNGTPGDPALATLAMATTYDACSLEFDFIPNGDTVSFNYQFGSEEYINATCGPYNDAFAFFISGPGITGTQNIALVPGTNIPITVNSVNSGVPGPGYSIGTCSSMGPGSPFTSYYYNNTAGTQLTYKGFTVKMRAYHSVTPCSTYHLKLAICDAGNRLYDSGVFIEAGSLKTNSFHFDHIDSVGHTINGLPNTIVKGCAPATIKIKSSHSSGSAQTVHLSFGGTAVQNTDFTSADSAIIAAGTDSVLFNVSGIQTPTGGVKTLRIYLISAFSCGIADSIDLNIIDTPFAHILTPDTTICSGTGFTVKVAATPGLAYNWTPVTGLNNPSIIWPVMSPSATTSYVMTATWLNTGCPPIVRNITVNVIDATVTLNTPDTILCDNGSLALDVSGPAALNYSWVPAAGLSNPNVQNPIASPSVTTTYTLTATDAGGQCPTVDTVNISVGLIDVSLSTHDTTICKGSSVFMHVNGYPRLLYSWTPTTGVSNIDGKEPSLSPAVTTTYTMNASIAGYPCFVTDQITIHVTSVSLSNITPDQAIKYGSSIQLYVDGSYYYMWAPDDGSLNNNNINNPIATPLVPTEYTVYGMDQNGCRASAAVKIDLYYENYSIPSAFTPNGDGSNDRFKVENLGFNKLVEMSVFNRWGNLVYHSADGGNIGWDGSFNGTPQNLGTYNYMIVVSDPEGNLSHLKGSVTLIR